MTVNWKKIGIVALGGAGAVAAGMYTQKKTKSMPMALAAGAATAALIPIAAGFLADKMGISLAGLVMENVAGLVMENVGAMPSLRDRSALGDYRGLVMENVAGLYDYM